MNRWFYINVVFWDVFVEICNYGCYVFIEWYRICVWFCFYICRWIFFFGKLVFVDD